MSCLHPLNVRHPRRRSAKWQSRQSALFHAGDWDTYLYERNTTPQRLEVPCGRCSECRRQRAASWRHRLIAEHLYGNHQNAIFVTLTISDEHYDDYPEGLVPQYLRIFWENYRNFFADDERARIPKYWFTTERGDENGRLHLHGIIWDSEFYVPEDCYDKSTLYYQRSHGWIDDRQKEIAHAITTCWPFGFVYVGTECSARTMSYITKYITKETQYDNSFISRTYCSPGIGRAQLDNGSLRLEIRRAFMELACPMVPSSRKRVPAPRYFIYRCLSDLERRQVSDRRLALSRDGTLPFTRFLRGHKFTSESVFLEYRRRLYEEDIRLGLVRKYEKARFRPADYWRNSIVPDTNNFNIF